MLNRFPKYPLLAAALVAGSAQAQCLTFGEQEPVRSTYVDCLRTSDWREKIHFGFARTDLADEERKVLDDLTQRLLAMDPESVTVTAHADRIGERDYNARLAARRAHTIRAYLADKGVSEDLVRLESKGSTEPTTARLCEALGSETRQNAKLIACLQPDRRVDIEIAGRHKAVR
jgi:outer membrane protein OmpA-like peptidoglycan-associated protein